MPKETDKVFCAVPITDYKASRHDARLLGYHSYLRPAVEFYCTPDEVFDWQKSLYFGVELEMDSNNYRVSGYRNDAILDCQNIMQSNKYGYFMSDGSLNRGMEFITQPSTLAFYQSNRKMFGVLFDTLKQYGYNADRMSTCGFHVHFNRDFYKDNESQYVENLLFLVNRYWDDIVYCSKRRVNSIIRWSDKYRATPKEIVEDMEHGHIPSRYHCVNLNNRDTIEFRMWHGTLDIDTFYGILTLVSNMVIMAKTHSQEEIEKMPFDMLITSPELAKLYFDATKPIHTKKYESFLKER